MELARLIIPFTLKIDGQSQNLGHNKAIFFINTPITQSLGQFRSAIFEIVEETKMTEFDRNDQENDRIDQKRPLRKSADRNDRDNLTGGPVRLPRSTKNLFDRN